MFRALCAYHQEVKIVLYSIWHHHTCRWPSGAQVERGDARSVKHKKIDYKLLSFISFLYSGGGVIMSPLILWALMGLLHHRQTIDK